MTGYGDLTWTTLSFVKRHLYRRLATPLNQALGRLAIARHVTAPEEMRAQVIRAEQSLEIALNLVKAWAVLIHVKSGGIIRQDQRRPIAPDGLPAWLVEHLSGPSTFQAGQTRPVVVQAETFYESLALMSLVGSRVGTLKKLVMADALDDDQRVSVRAIFDPPPAGPYASLGAMFKRFNTQVPAEQDTGFHLQVLQELLWLNGATLRLQNNQQTGEQALAAGLWVTAFAGERGGLPDTSSAQARVAASAGDSQETALAQWLRSSGPHQHMPAPAAASDSPSASARAAAAADPGIENESDTLIVPPVGFHERLAALLNVPAPELEVENQADTLIVPPPDYRQRLSRQRPVSPPGPLPGPEGGDQDSTG